MSNNASRPNRLEELKAELQRAKRGLGSFPRAAKDPTLSFYDDLHGRVQHLAASGVNIVVHGDTVILGHPDGGTLYEKVINTLASTDTECADFLEAFLEASTTRYLERMLQALGCQPQLDPQFPGLFEGIFKTRALHARLHLDSESGKFTLVLDLSDGVFRIQQNREIGTWPTTVDIKSVLSEIDSDLTLLSKLAVFLSARKLDWESCGDVISSRDCFFKFQNGRLFLQNSHKFEPEANWHKCSDTVAIARDFLTALRTPPLVTPTPTSTMQCDVELG